MRKFALVLSLALAMAMACSTGMGTAQPAGETSGVDTTVGLSAFSSPTVATSSIPTAAAPTPTPEPLETYARLYLLCVENVSPLKCGEPDDWRVYVIPDNADVQISEKENGRIHLECNIPVGNPGCSVLPTEAPPTPQPTATPLPTTTPTPLNKAAKAMHRACTGRVSREHSDTCGMVEDWKVVAVYWPHKFDATDSYYYGRSWIPINSESGKEEDNLLRPTDVLIMFLSADYYIPMRQCENKGIGHCKNIPMLIREYSLDPVQACMDAHKQDPRDFEFFRFNLVWLARGFYDGTSRCRNFY